MKCTSLNLCLKGCLGLKDKMSSTTLKVHVHTLSQHYYGCHSAVVYPVSLKKLSSFPLSLFLTIAEWFLISRLMLKTSDGISPCLTFSLKLLLSVASFSLNTLRPFFARFISCFRSFNWKLCTACSEQNFIFRSAKPQKILNYIIFNALF